MGHLLCVCVYVNRTFDSYAIICHYHRSWVDCGRPPAGKLSFVMRSTRARYHRAVRDLKRNQADLSRTKLADRAASGDSKHFWNEVKKLNGSKSTMPTQVDGFDEDVDIANRFAD